MRATTTANELKERWDNIVNPGAEHTEQAMSHFLQTRALQRSVLNCAATQARAKTLTDFTLPVGMEMSDCLNAAGTGNFPEALKDWKYTPKIQSERQLPQMVALPQEHASLVRGPWFQSPSQATWLALNARHIRYHHQLWLDIKPKVLRGVHTTLVTVTPQIGYALTPHIQLEKSFLFLGALARGLCPVQLFPAKYLYPDAQLGSFKDGPAPIFADVLPATGGYAYPVVDTEPDPWRVLTRYEKTDRYYGYPFAKATHCVDDFTLENYEPGCMLLPNGKKVCARQSQSYVYATLDPKLKEELKQDREQFEESTCLLRGTVTHDGLPFQLPVEMQSMVYAIVLTQWEMELDNPGDLSSYALKTQHAAIRGFNFYQRVDPYYRNFMRMVAELSKDPDFKTYPLATHLTHSWLGGNLRISNQLSPSEKEFGPEVMRNFYHQQLDWQCGVTNLMNHVGFRTKQVRSGLASRTGMEIERLLEKDGLLFHQMQRMLRFDSHLFQCPLKRASFWPDFNPAWRELDREVRVEHLPRLY